MKEREVRCKVGEGGRVGERWGREELVPQFSIY